MTKTVSNFKRGLSITICLLIHQSLFAHNAVTYISEEAIIIIGFGGLLILLGLIFGIIGLFRKNKAFRVMNILAAILVSVITLISFSSRSFSNNISPLFLGLSLILWGLILFRKSDESNHKTKPIVAGVLEGISIIAIGWIITVCGQRIIPAIFTHRLLLYFIQLIVIGIILFIGHNWFYNQHEKSKIALTVKPGIHASLYAVASVNILFFTPIIIQYMVNGYGYMGTPQVLRIFALSSIPIFILGWVFSVYQVKKRLSSS